MSRKQLAALFVCALVSWTIGNALLTLLPVYATRLGADPASIGNYLASSFFALTAGTVAGGWLSDRFQRRKLLLMLAGGVNFPATWLMGQATQFWQLVLLTALVWFMAGIGLAATNILAGLFAGEAERGKVFGILSLNNGLGGLIGGLASGAIVSRWGFPALFEISAFGYLLQPLAALFLEDKRLDTVKDEVASTLSTKPALSRAFYLLLLVNTLAWAASFVAALGRPLLMDQLRFDPAAISSVVAVAGAVSLPFPLLVGWLADHMDRYRLLALCYLAAFVGLFILAASGNLWQFWVSAILLNAVGGPSISVGSALVTDLIPRDSLGVGLSRWGATNWIGGVVGFVGTGYAIQTLGMTKTFIMGAFLILAAVILLARVQQAWRIIPA